MKGFLAVTLIGISGLSLLRSLGSQVFPCFRSARPEAAEYGPPAPKPPRSPAESLVRDRLTRFAVFLQPLSTEDFHLLLGRPRPDSERLPKLARVESEIDPRYRDLRNGEMLRRWIALGISSLEDVRPELSRYDLLNALMKDAVGVAQDLRTALARIPVSAGSERREAIRLVTFLSANDRARPLSESILLGEAQRPVPAGGEAQLHQLLDAYSEIVSDARKRARFLEILLEAQTDPAAIRYIRTRWGGLVPPERVPAEAAPKAELPPSL